MKHFDIFGHTLNAIEFVFFIVFPGGVIILILLYILFNIRYMNLSYDMDLEEKLKAINSMENNYKDSLNNMIGKIEEEEKKKIEMAEQMIQDESSVTINNVIK